MVQINNQFLYLNMWKPLIDTIVVNRVVPPISIYILNTLYPEKK